MKFLHPYVERAASAIISPEKTSSSSILLNTLLFRYELFYFFFVIVMIVFLLHLGSMHQKFVYKAQSENNSSLVWAGLARASNFPCIEVQIIVDGYNRCSDLINLSSFVDTSFDTSKDSNHVNWLLKRIKSKILPQSLKAYAEAPVPFIIGIENCDGAHEFLDNLDTSV